MNPRRITPSMSLLVAFEASGRHLSFTRAAVELSLTQSAISRHVQALEALLEVELFRREGRQIALTDIGVSYLRQVGTAIQAIRNASIQAMAYRAGGRSLHLAVLPTFASKWLMPRLTSFYAEYPDVLLHVHTRIGPFDLGLAGMDAAIGAWDGRDESWLGLDSHHLMDETLLPVISTKLNERMPASSSQDLAKHLLLQTISWPTNWRKWFEEQDVSESSMRLGPQFELTSHLIQAVVAGVGTGLVPRYLIEDELRAGVLQVAIDKPLDIGVANYLFVPPSRSSLPHVAAFISWLLKVKDQSPVA